jgi:hypothetical protein
LYRSVFEITGPAPAFPVLDPDKQMMNKEILDLQAAEDEGKI